MRIWGPHKQLEFSLEIPYHSIGCPTFPLIWTQAFWLVWFPIEQVQKILWLAAQPFPPIWTWAFLLVWFPREHVQRIRQSAAQPFPPIWTEHFRWFNFQENKCREFVRHSSKSIFGMLEPTSQCIISMKLTLPNQCLYKGCGTPLTSSRMIDPVAWDWYIKCHQFLVFPGVNMSTLLCLVCHDKESTITLALITTAQTSSAGSDYSTALPTNWSTIFPPKVRVQTIQEVGEDARAAYKRLQIAHEMS